MGGAVSPFYSLPFIHSKFSLSPSGFPIILPEGKDTSGGKQLAELWWKCPWQEGNSYKPLHLSSFAHLLSMELPEMASSETV